MDMSMDLLLKDYDTPFENLIGMLNSIDCNLYNCCEETVHKISDNAMREIALMFTEAEENYLF